MTSADDKPNSRSRTPRSRGASAPPNRPSAQPPASNPRSRGALAPPNLGHADEPPPPAKRFITRPRLRDFDYSGAYAYHVTIVSRVREPILIARADPITHRLTESANSARFELLVYTIMPDHLHLLVAGMDESSNLVRFVQRFKQTTGFDYTRESGKHL